MKTQHSPGPWRVAKQGEIESADGSPIADVAVFVQWNTTDGIKEEAMPWESNAKLIAAAPELLDALRELYETALVMECIPLYKGLKKAQTLIDKLTDQ